MGGLAVVALLCSGRGPLRLGWRMPRPDTGRLKRILNIGLPAGAEQILLQVALLNLRQDDMIPLGIVMSAALLAMLPSVIVYLLLQRHFHAGITAGAVKG